ncbi:alpha/beta hydrolase [Asticcacaulis sp. AND118]|uniref:alpha/beta hydrolase n=1 Tax=Asticcacaulis sp. AND118 TaxID=2840468 RepID=UPI001D0004AC|nr:alpha/beta fold hydrolase [Asticcacaulis sp. AND118]UDF03193.1 alpha/beta hydrolase [Asticcacaulis sp. AND118]
MFVQSESLAETPAEQADRLFEVFCTPEPLIEAAEKSMARVEERLSAAAAFRVPFQGGELQAYRFTGAGRGTVVLLHGWTGRAAVMTAFVEPLLAEGFDVLALDFPGHGRSDGDRLHVPLGVGALHALYAATGPWQGVVAHSFGGAVAFSALSDMVGDLAPLTYGRLVLIAAPCSMPRVFDTFARRHEMSPEAALHLKSHVKRLTGHPVEAFMGDEILRQHPIPTLILHAPEDQEVLFLSAEGFASAGDHVTLHPLPGLGHRRILYAKETVQTAVDFLAAQ